MDVFAAKCPQVIGRQYNHSGQLDCCNLAYS
jgi:hypothetical protein